MAERNQLVILVTDKCNARCEICGFYCGPEKNNVIDESFMLDIIDQAATVPSIDSIFFSGGEPMLFPELLAKGAERARKHNLRVVIVTNGFWGTWSPGKLADFFAQAKPDRVHFSTDSFHGAFIDDVTFGRAVAFTYAMGREAHIAISQMKAGPSAAEYWSTLGPYKHLYPYYWYNCSRFGRAEQFRSADFHDPKTTEKCRCVHDRSYGVSWNGFVYPCCKFESLYSSLVLGNIKDTSLIELLNNPVSEVVNLLEEEGFSPLLEAARQIDTSLPVGNFSKSCKVCHTLFRDLSFVRLYAALIKTPQVQNKIQAFLDFSDAREDLHALQWVKPDSRRTKRLNIQKTFLIN